MEYSGTQLTICNLYPVPMAPLLRPYAAVSVASRSNRPPGCTLFEIAPGSPTKPSILTVEDSWQIEVDVFANRSNDGSRRLIQVAHIAKDLAQDHWGISKIGTPDGLGPGIFICKGKTPTADEIEQVLAERQIPYQQWLFGEGDRLAFQQNWAAIDIHHIEAGKALGKEVPWVQARSLGAIQRCPWCQTQVAAQAFICSGCRNVLKELPPEFFRLQKQLPPEQQSASQGAARFNPPTSKQ